MWYIVYYIKDYLLFISKTVFSNVHNMLEQTALFSVIFKIFIMPLRWPLWDSFNLKMKDTTFLKHTKCPAGNFAFAEPLPFEKVERFKCAIINGTISWKLHTVSINSIK